MEDKYVVSHTLNLISDILREYHDSIIGGAHSGVERTIKRIKLVFWWKEMSKEIRKYVDECVVCQRMKTPKKSLKVF